MSQRSSMAWLGCIALLGFSIQACVGTVEVGSGGTQNIEGPLFDADKIDLLLVVDNSRSMADKQEILARASADLVQSVTNPPCVDANGMVGETPASPLDPCPPGQTRLHAPVTDIHVGVISTSLGGHGSDSCPDIESVTPICDPNPNLTNNDKAHLLSRKDACGGSSSVPTYQNQGFFAWDLHGSMSPPGTQDPGALASDIAAVVKGCPIDSTCAGVGGQPRMLTEQQDPLNLRCFDQKRRFGIDFLYPVDRYIDALTRRTIANRDGELVPNPIFSDLNPSDGIQRVRDPGLVYFASITGVPWQEIARNPMDLTEGFKNSSEMVQDGTWSTVLGDGSNLPTSPYMIESIAPRAGVSPRNPYNGGDRTIAENDDLQYACTFPLAMPRDCSDPNTGACDCADPNNDNPLCAPDPNNNGARTLQVAAKAYPSPRTMQVVRGVGEQGVLTSICPAQIDDASGADYAYRPVVRALVERMATRL